MVLSVAKRFWKTGLAVMVAAVMGVTVAACGPTGAAPSADSQASAPASGKVRSIDEIKKSGELRVAVFSDKAPFGYVDKSGEYQGYDVYFARRLAKDLGVKPVFTSVDPAARVDVLNANKVDVVLANFTKTPERAEKVDFAKPYMQVALGVVSPDGAVIRNVDELKGKELIVAKGTTAETYFTKHYPDVKLVKYDQYADAYAALLDHRGAAFSTDNTEVLAWAKANKGFTVGITSLGDVDTINPAVRKGNKELLDYINEQIVKLGKEDFFLKDYDATLKPVYGTAVDPNTIVVEGGVIKK